MSDYFDKEKFDTWNGKVASVGIWGLGAATLTSMGAVVARGYQMEADGTSPFFSEDSWFDEAAVVLGVLMILFTITAHVGTSVGKREVSKPRR